MKIRNLFTLLFILIGFNLLSFCKEKPKMLWFDATANFKRLGSYDGIVNILDKCVEVGITDIIVDVKPISGEVLYDSKYAPKMKTWDDYTRPDTFDFVNTLIKEARKRGLKIHIALNVFCEGHNYYDRGVVYWKHPEWATIIYTKNGFIPITQQKHKYSAMVNPALEQVQEYELKIIEEIVKSFDIDGIVLDRVRYDGIYADFSDSSRVKFETWLGRKIKFPDDIFRIEGDSIVRGKYFKEWLKWRASVIKSFIEKARNVVKRAKPSILFGDYVGSWYLSYYELGVNWASEKFKPKFDWATDDYNQTGYAELVDFLCTGLYFYEVTKEEVESKGMVDASKLTEPGMKPSKSVWYSVEGSAEIVKQVTMNAVPVYGSLYVEQYKGEPERFKKAMEVALEKTDGLMIFDLVHIENYQLWDVLKEVLKSKSGGRN
ncbi:Glycosyl hydrolase-like 10 [Candidatus Kryptonium thompsonii]|uniref:Glycosyl hydrolase-like 10 n=1 Tax=Candidatus Kryptonium thompsonii TaxID=1633631 RepID=A0ABM9UTU9_9BACT|nr:alpha amylase family protein [Candidatus Kryptonium thompsoni]CUS81806.1 Glycosyl hydrolase-like 10 [Candidatus Kryptonium thompsoni]CUS83729.1 Glycosyl hydrolase-like 10 [Candidatus Kryptonium thompsoni]CUS84805.1 Glycosyl hydrolase-like 10 [Candidatus Kryptonium thompsoni]CUS87673.1 Glycosyl hydrolase-like 10 [Candidatus Kryptonium thompsoni]CUS89848.1 Glycosyl hydrolase-like 10 [Candidatus Kryptonium thompsoni]